MYAVLVHHLGSYHDATKEAAGVLHPKRTTFEQNNGKRLPRNGDPERKSRVWVISQSGYIALLQAFPLVKWPVMEPSRA